MNSIPNRFESPEPVYFQEHDRNINPDPNRIDEHDLITNNPIPPSIDKEHEGWLYGGGRYAPSSTLFSDVILPPTPVSWTRKSYRVLCCVSRKGAAAWVTGIIIVVIIAVVLAVELSHSHANTEGDNKINATAVNNTTSHSTTKIISPPPPIIGSSASASVVLLSETPFSTHASLRISSQMSATTRSKSSIHVPAMSTVIDYSTLTDYATPSSAFSTASPSVSVSVVYTSSSSTVAHRTVVPP